MIKKVFQSVFLIALITGAGLMLTSILAPGVFAQSRISGGGVWRQIDDAALQHRGLERQIVPDSYSTFKVDRAALQAILNSAPMEFSGSSKPVLALPMPDGSYQRFKIEESPVMEQGLADKFPEIKTYRAQGIDDPTASCRFDLLLSGFHAMIISSTGTSYIDPYAKGDTSNYVVHWKGTLRRTGDPTYCVLNNEIKGFTGGDENILPDRAEAAPEVTSGSQLRTYRLAVAADGEYTQAVGGGTVSGGLAAEVLIMNRVNGVYERDLAIHMNIIANNNLIIYTNPATDPYNNDDPDALLDANQSNLDSVIGAANYDIGHVFTTGGGGLADLGVVCDSSFKAEGETGLPNPVGDDFAIDFVAHEMGHQFGGDHTFNTSCGGNRAFTAAYEPGSGITIMAYAGVCGAQDLALHSIDTFHVKSLQQIVAYSQTGGGNACAATTASGNTPPTVSVTGGPSWNIPKQTPFTLSATGSDVNGDTVTYDWQEFDLGTATSAVPNTDADGVARPIFRPYLPTTGSRTFPQLTYILNNANVPPSTYGGGLMTGELLPAITRTMSFQVIARDNHANAGGINTATATVVVNAASGPFVVTAPNTAVTWAGASTQTVTWDVANTSASPISAANVKISFSSDGGLTFPTVLNASTPNDGSETVTVPNVTTSAARIKVEAVGNIFFDISNVNFTTTANAVPVRSRADFDGDGKTDLSVFRPSDGNWYLQRSSAGFTGVNFGISTDTPAPGDYDNDNKTDVAIYRSGAQSAFYVIKSATGTVAVTSWGSTGDVPTAGDYDGDGATDVAVFRPSNGAWYVSKSTGGTAINLFGQAGDTPVIGDFDGDGKADLSVFRSGVWYTLRSTNGNTMITSWGLSGDLPVSADYDGDNKDDVAIFRPSNGTWYILNSGGATVITAFGASGDIPVPGDYDGDGKDDIGIYRNGTWYVNRSTAGLLISNFGLAGDKPAPKGYQP
jgi:hypothetical protein